MKATSIFIATLVSCWLWSPAQTKAQTTDSLGLPGDNLNLYAVLDIFQKSETLEEFEKSINSEDSKINNLDLNNDNKTDYIRVIDNVKGTAHAIVLQTNITEKETQDIAVIEVEQDADKNVQIQVIGDEMLYGKNYIIEPKQNENQNLKSTAATSTPNPGYTGNSTQVTNVTNNYYNNNYNSNNTNSGYSPYYNNYWYPVSSWAIVRYLYVPTYTVYVSPWYWGYYPVYWRPWTPLFWHSYYYGWIHPHHHHYHGWYYKSGTIKNTSAHDYYYGKRRTTSAYVAQHKGGVEYQKTYSRPDLASKQIAEAKTPANGSKAVGNTSAKPNVSAKPVQSKEYVGSSKEVTSKPSYNTSQNKVNTSGSTNSGNKVVAKEQTNTTAKPSINHSGNSYNNNSSNNYSNKGNINTSQKYTAPQSPASSGNMGSKNYGSGNKTMSSPNRSNFGGSQSGSKSSPRK